MALITLKPTSAGRRAMVRVSTPGLHKGDPYGPLTESQNKTGGRNHYGRITTRHKGGGSKQNYRIIDFKRDKEGIACRVERLEYDPNRTAHIALLCYVDGERRYIIAPKGISVGDQLIAGRESPIKTGNSLPLRNIPVGSTVHCIEMKPGKGAQIARSAGASVQLVAREGALRHVASSLRRNAPRAGGLPARPSAKSATPNTTCASSAKPVRSVGAAFVPTVRGAAMNPVDHPHGGGEAKAGQGNPHPVSPWGQPSKGYKTRKNKRTTQFIVRDRRRLIGQHHGAFTQERPVHRPAPAQEGGRRGGCKQQASDQDLVASLDDPAGNGRV